VTAAISTEWRLETGDRSGSWLAINKGLDNKTYSKTISKPVFLLDVSHGAAPAGDSLAYAVLPGVGTAGGAAAAVAGFEASAKVVANSGAAQAVLATPDTGEDVLMIVAWPAATATTVDGGKPGLKVTLPAPAKGGLLTVATKTARSSGPERVGATANGSVTTTTVFSAADPTNAAEGGELVFTIDSALEELQQSPRVSSGGDDDGSAVSCKKSGTSTTVTVTLPTGTAAGSTVSGSC
jgi:hypothetical protein